MGVYFFKNHINAMEILALKYMLIKNGRKFL